MRGLCHYDARARAKKKHDNVKRWRSQAPKLRERLLQARAAATKLCTVRPPARGKWPKVDEKVVDDFNKRRAAGDLVRWALPRARTRCASWGPGVRRKSRARGCNLARARSRRHCRRATWSTSRRVHPGFAGAGVHVKGHSADGGNDHADELVQWGKTGGPYCRVREGGGEGEGRYGAATTVALATATAGDSAMGQIYGSVPARRGFEAANAALNVFNSVEGNIWRPSRPPTFRPLSRIPPTLNES
jgi:hypothetical protein